MEDNKAHSRFPRFFNYNEDAVDHGYEALQDFFLSWMLRCSTEETKHLNLKLYEYTRRAVYFLLFVDFEPNGTNLQGIVPDNFKVLKVTTRRQKGGIDLLAEIQIELNSEIQEYLLNVENKWYTHISKNQLTKYQSIVLREYGNKFSKDYLVNCVIFCDYEILNENDKALCRENNYKLLTVDDIKNFMILEGGGETGNYMFDEYWFRFSG